MVDGTKFVGANGDRAANDLYPTPDAGAVVGALLSIWRPTDLFVWECACGNGSLSTALDREGFAVYSTDLFDYGFGLPGVDYLRVRKPESTLVITNPPWNRARDWIFHSRAIGIEKMALLLPLNFFASAIGLKTFELWRPRYVLPLTWRLGFKNIGRPVLTCQWVVWDLHDLGATEFILLRKPARYESRKVRFA